MKTRNRIKAVLTFAAAAMATLAITAPSANAAVIQTNVNSTTELLYAGDVSAVDLLNGLIGVDSGTAWSTPSSRLNDGVHGDTFAVDNTNSITWTGNNGSAIVTYDLGLGTNGLGYDITSIQSIAAWNSAAFGNQGWTVATQLKDAGSFTTLETVDYQPLASGIGATKSILTDDTGVLASGVEFVRFTANSVNGGANGGRFTFREIDVFGTSTSAASVTPEPSTFILAALGLLRLIGFRRWRNRS